MTKDKLKKLIRQIILESNSRVGYYATLRNTAAALKQKMADLEAAKAAEAAKLAQVKPISSLSRAVNIIARIQDLSRKIDELESQVPKRSDETDAEYYARVVAVLKEKTQLEIDRLEYLLQFEKNAK